jgi:TctA family transporter
MLISQGSVTIFFSNALVASIMSLGLLMLLWPLLGSLLGTMRRAPRKVVGAKQ